MFNIAIIGAGPAGSTLARLIGRQYRVLLIDRRQMDREPAPGMWVKSCGGLVAPDAQKVMAELGLGLPSSVVVGPQLFAVRTIDLPRGLERYYQRFYINIDREKFDRWLVSLAAGVETRFGCLFTGMEQGADGVTLKLRRGNEHFTEHAHVVVGADGASSLLRRLAAPREPMPEKYISIQQWFRAERAEPYFSALFDWNVTDFYSWTIPKGDRLLVGAALPAGADAHARFGLLKQSLPKYGYDLSQPLEREGAAILRPTSARQVCTGAGAVALVGEAAGFISPSSSEGFSYAMSSAIALARSLQPGIEGFPARYRRETRSIRAKIMLKNAKSPFMYHPVLRGMVLRSGLDSLTLHGPQTPQR